MGACADAIGDVESEAEDLGKGRGGRHAHEGLIGHSDPNAITNGREPW